jgi:1-phosphatidylinositol-3-phosphate 5-kinase
VHVFPDSLIIVREDEPSSIIAFTLASRHYKEKLTLMKTGTPSSDPPSLPNPGERYLIEFDDGDEEILLRGTGTHIRYRT